MVVWKYYNKRIHRSNLDCQIANLKDELAGLEDELKYFCFSKPEAIRDCEGNFIQPNDYLPQTITDLLCQIKDTYFNITIHEAIEEEKDTEYVEWDDEE